MQPVCGPAKVLNFKRILLEFKQIRPGVPAENPVQ